jgi:hypothetical protein
VPSDRTRHETLTTDAKEHAVTSIDAETATLLKDGPRGALVVAGLSTGLLFIGWLLFYFLLFIPRGSVG